MSSCDSRPRVERSRVGENGEFSSVGSPSWSDLSEGGPRQRRLQWSLKDAAQWDSRPRPSVRPSRDTTLDDPLGAVVAVELQGVSDAAGRDGRHRRGISRGSQDQLGSARNPYPASQVDLRPGEPPEMLQNAEPRVLQKIPRRKSFAVGDLGVHPAGLEPATYGSEDRADAEKPAENKVFLGS